jgi:hypothetical protein
MILDDRSDVRATERGRPAPRTLGVAMPRGYGTRPRLGPEAAAAFATYVDPARARAAIEGRTLVYTVRWNSPGGPALAGPDVR